MRRRSFLKTGLAGMTVVFLPSLAVTENGSALILRQLNALRRERCLPRLHLCPDLTEITRLQVLHMHLLGHITHAGPGGEDPSARGLTMGYGGRILGEALAEGRNGRGAIMEAWLAHEKTRAVLLDTQARKAGLFGAENAAGTTRWGLVLGA